MRIKHFLIPAVVIIIANSCINKSPEIAKKDILIEDMDTTVNPATDFFQYANGGWLKRNPIPNDQSSWGIGNLVDEENNRRFKEINEKAAAANAAKGSSDQKIGDFWKTAMDSAKAEALGLKPLQPWFDKINAISDVKSLVNTVAQLKKIGSSTLFADFVNQDSKNSDVMTYTVWQGGIGLPEREYYFRKDSATANIRNEYVKYIAKVLNMSGEDSNQAKTDAKDIMELETKLATASRTLNALRDDYKNYNKFAITDLPKLTSEINWTSYLSVIGVKDIDSVIVGQPEFFKALGNVLKATPVNVWKSYLKFNLVSDFSAELPNAYAQAAFDFGRLFSGAKARRPRWKIVIGQENGLMGQILGQLYVKEYVSPKDKERYEKMTEAIRNSLKDHISKLTWMSDSTKQKAYEKLASMKKKVFYPDKWRDYSALEIGTDSYVQNVINANEWRHNYQYNKLGKPVDRDEWGMNPQTYNAQYDPSNNDITLPAAQFIVPGYKDSELDDAIVYGYGAASTIGHEITHGFDDQGRKYDAHGNLKKWWTDKDSAEFTKRAQLIIKQFDEFEPVKGYHINGDATQGENIADLGGIVLGIDAFKKTEQYKKGEKINGLTPMQRFFLGYALGWLWQGREELLRRQLLTDVHSPAKYRVNGPFMDVDEFYSTFNIKPGDPMYRADSLRARIW
ncbi:MAG: M13 family metallopeptidase [Bacteroidetes bacterium]|nr:M13 family metallopeptidase [Bacteroidota bacterium]MBS1931778.1 M13 family metallopeptidase [Bacteroidota bacterium]